MVLGLLLARAGVEVTVLEKHEDFLHDFRGDTVHPATLQLLDELGLGLGSRGCPRPGSPTSSCRTGTAGSGGSVISVRCAGGECGIRTW